MKLLSVAIWIKSRRKSAASFARGAHHPHRRLRTRGDDRSVGSTALALYVQSLYNVIMKNYTVYIEKDEDGVLIGSIPSLPGCYTQGATMNELLDNIREVAALCARNTDIAPGAEFVGVQTVSVSTT